MIKKTTFLKTLLVATCLLMGVNAWAYTPALTSSKEVAGYKFKAYYDISNTNVDDMCPASGDLRFRGAGYGFFNFGSGNRSADVALSVAANDLLLVEFKDTQSRSVTVNSISNCTKNDTQSAGEILAFDVNTTATSLNFNIGRAGCIIAILVMEKDNEAATADYTINYKYGGTTVKTVSGNVPVGTVVPVLSSFFESDVKYITLGEQATSLTVEAGGSTLNINVRQAELYAWTATSNVGSYSISGNTLEGEKASVKYPLYVNNSGTLYTKAAINKVYAQDVDVTVNNQAISLEYSATDIANVVFLAEVEDIPGMGIVDNGNAAIRSSQCAAGYSISGNTLITSLPQGKYQITACFYSPTSAGGSYNFFAGNRNIWAPTTENSNVTNLTTTFVLAKDNNDIFLGQGRALQAVDFVYIQSLGAPTAEELADAQAADLAADYTNVTIAATGSTFASTVAIDCANLPAGVKAYQVSAVAGNKATLTEVTEAVQAGTGLILIATAAGSYSLPVVTSGNDISATNKLVGVTAAKTVAADEAYGLKNGKFNKLEAGTIPAGKAYLPATAVSAPELSIEFGGVTGIADVRSKMEEVRGDIFDLQGRKVAQPTKGLYIQNGRKVILK